MKKFKFSLDSVLSYRQQVLGTVQAEHAEILAQVRDGEQALSRLWEEYRSWNDEFQHRVISGLPVTDVLMYQSTLRAMEREIQHSTARLEELRKKEEKKRAEVIEAKKDATSIEKLKDKKLSVYHKEKAKSEERFVEEFISMTRVAGSAGV